MHTIESWHGLEPFAEVWDDREEQVPGVWCRGNLRLVPKSPPRGVCYLPTRSTLSFNLNACPKNPPPNLTHLHPPTHNATVPASAVCTPGLSRGLALACSRPIRSAQLISIKRSQRPGPFLSGLLPDISNPTPTTRPLACTVGQTGFQA